MRFLKIVLPLLAVTVATQACAPSGSLRRRWRRVGGDAEPTTCVRRLRNARPGSPCIAPRDAHTSGRS